MTDPTCNPQYPTTTLLPPLLLLLLLLLPIPPLPLPPRPLPRRPLQRINPRRNLNRIPRHDPLLRNLMSETQPALRMFDISL